MPSPPAHACSVGDRTVLHGAKRARAARHGFRHLDHDISIPLLPNWRGVGAEEPRPTAWGRVRPALAVKTTTPSPPAHACSVGGRTVLHGPKRARAARHGVWALGSRRFNITTADLARCRCGRASANGEGRSAARVCREDDHAKSVSTRVLRGRPAGFLRREAHAGRAARGLETAVTLLQSQCCRPGAVPVRKSLGQRRGVECGPRLPPRQPRQVRQRVLAPWAVDLHGAKSAWAARHGV